MTDTRLEGAADGAARQTTAKTLAGLANSVTDAAEAVVATQRLGSASEQREIEPWLTESPQAKALRGAVSDAALNTAFEELWDQTRLLLAVNDDIAMWLAARLSSGAPRRGGRATTELINRVDEELANAAHLGRFPPEWTVDPDFQAMLSRAVSALTRATKAKNRIVERVTELTREGN